MTLVKIHWLLNRMVPEDPQALDEQQGQSDSKGWLG